MDHHPLFPYCGRHKSKTFEQPFSSTVKISQQICKFAKFQIFISISVVLLVKRYCYNVG